MIQYLNIIVYQKKNKELEKNYLIQEISKLLVIPLVKKICGHGVQWAGSSQKAFGLTWLTPRHGPVTVPVRFRLRTGGSGPRNPGTGTVTGVGRLHRSGYRSGYGSGPGRSWPVPVRF